MENTAPKTHPMIVVAAIAVTVASLAAIASFTGLLPGKSAPESPLTATIPPPPEIVQDSKALEPAPAAPAKAERFAPPPPAKAHKTQSAARANPPSTGDLRHTSEQATASYPPNNAGIDAIPAPPPNTPPPVCRECGTVEAVREITTPAEGSGLGAVAGGVLGGLLGHQVGRGKGNTAATVVGAVGGAVAGHQTEKYVRSEKQLQVTVRFEDGSQRTINQEGGSRWQVGDHVRLNNGSLQPN